MVVHQGSKGSVCFYFENKLVSSAPLGRKSMKDYENLALNIAEIKRYLEQQSEIIVYYEKAMTEELDKSKEK